MKAPFPGAKKKKMCKKCDDTTSRLHHVDDLSLSRLTRRLEFRIVAAVLYFRNF